MSSEMLTGVGRGRGRGKIMNQQQPLDCRKIPQKGWGRASIMNEIRSQYAADVVGVCEAIAPAPTISEKSCTSVKECQSGRLESIFENVVSKVAGKEPIIEDKKKPKTPDLLATKVTQRFSVTDVDYEKILAQVQIKINGTLTSVKAKFLLKTPAFSKWKQTNTIFEKCGSIVELALLSAFEMNSNRIFNARNIRERESDFFILEIDICDMVNNDGKFREDFYNSLYFNMIPKLVKTTEKRLAYFGSVGENYQVSLVFISNVFLAMKEMIGRVQEQMNVYEPGDKDKQKLFLELIVGFKMVHFLAFYKEDWKKLYRIKVVGVMSENMVNAHFLDLGKTIPIDLKNLAISYCSRLVPESLLLIPPLATPVRLTGIDELTFQEIKKYENKLELKMVTVCILEDMHDAKENSGDPPAARIFAGTNVFK